MDIKQEILDFTQNEMNLRNCECANCRDYNAMQMGKLSLLIDKHRDEVIAIQRRVDEAVCKAKIGRILDSIPTKGRKYDKKHGWNSHCILVEIILRKWRERLGIKI